MTNAEAIRGAAHDSTTSGHLLESLAVTSLFGLAAFTQLSIAVAQALLLVAIVCWVALVVIRRERVEVPTFFYPLLAYAGWTLLSAAFSLDPRRSLADCKQLALFLIVPATYRLIRGSRTSTMLTVIMSVGAATAAFGIFQYGLLHYDQLNQRPQGTLGHYMTYSGLLMLVIGTALAKLLFDPEKTWPALVMPALLLAVALTSTRMAWVGVCAAAAVLLLIKDFRLLAILPIVGAITFAAAGPAITQRLMSMFDAKDPTRRDRVAMLLEGRHMVRDHPLFGVGPNMVEEVYAQYRVAEAVEQINPHLHNVPMQIAAERGLPALVLWLAFLGVLCRDLYRNLRTVRPRTAAAAAIAAIAAMLAAGLFEYNFGDSEFLMMFLLLITLPFTVARAGTTDTADA